MLRRAISVVLTALMLVSPFHPAGATILTTRRPAVEAQAPLFWVVEWFGEAFASWVAGKGFDYLATRAGLLDGGRAALNNIDQILQVQGLEMADRQQLATVREQYVGLVTMLEDNARSDAQLRSDFMNLRADFIASMRRISIALRAMNTRITGLEIAQATQYKLIVDLQGQVATLQRRTIDQDGRIVDLEQRTDNLEHRTRDLEVSVYADPERFLRNGWALSGSALYGNSVSLSNAARIGIDTELQYNFTKHIGLFTDVFWSPLNATDVSGFPSESRVLWQSLGGVLGLMANVMPPESPVSLQLEGGGGVLYSSLSEFESGASVFDWGHANRLGNVSNVAAVGRAELGLAPPASRIEPFLSMAYIRSLDKIAVTTESGSSDAGNTLWYATIGLRMRVYHSPSH